MKATSPTPAAMIDRLVDILATFEVADSLTLAQVVVRTGIPRSSAHRILEHMVKVRWLRKAGNTYHLGLGMLELGTLAAHRDTLHAAAVPDLHELHERTGMVVHLAVLDGSDIVYLEKIGGRMGMRVPSRIGGRAPAHCTAAGKILLAQTRTTEPNSRPAGPLVRLTDASITTERLLRLELERITARGVAFDREESASGIGCVSASIGPSQAPVASISVCAPIGRINLENLVTPVRTTAQHIWGRLRSGRIPAPPASLSEGRPRLASAQ